MMKMVFCAFVLVSCSIISGCSTIKYTIKDVDCNAVYIGGMFPTKSYPVKVTQTKVDSVGNQWIRMKNNLDVKFNGRWQKVDLFKNFKCNGDSWLMEYK